jgi:DNA-binding NtrC family response regulator
MSKKILVVDDDQRLCHELASCLEDEGYCAEYAYDAIRGMELVIQNQYDVVFLDVKIPNANGFELLNKIKTILPEASVVIITAHPFIEQLIKDENVSSLLSGVLKKPFSMETLLEKIKTL